MINGSPLAEEDRVPPPPPVSSLPSVVSRPPFWLVPLLVMVLSLNITSGLFMRYYASSPIEHRAIAALGSHGDFANVNWDDLSYIPRMNAVATGHGLSDPWNCYNPHWQGWGAFGLVPPLIGGFFLYLCNNFFLAMFSWGQINYALISLVIYLIFRSPPLSFTWSASICLTYFLLNSLFSWVSAYRFLLPLRKVKHGLQMLIYGVGNADHNLPLKMIILRIEAGLLTFVFYFLFLWAYWRFWSQPSWRRAIGMGVLAGLLTYVYFFHYIFAFAFMSSHLLWAACRRRGDEALLLTGAIGIGILVALPYLFNNLFLLDPAYYLRLDYIPGRWPGEDYRWLVHFVLPLEIGLVYLVLRPAAPVKSLLIGTWVNLGCAYFLVLSLPLVLGFTQAPDHFWRYSLALPASLWSLAAVADLLRAYLGSWRPGKRLLALAAFLLPFFILARVAFTFAGFFQEPPVSQRLSPAQHRLLDKLSATDQVLRPGEGFLAGTPILNYHIMANLKGRPFLAPGVSSLSPEEVTRRYLVGTYLLGGERVSYPQAIPPKKRRANYLYQTDVNLYLYINQFNRPWSDRRQEAGIKALYRQWPPPWLEDPETQRALAAVRAVYVDSPQAAVARERLGRFFIIEQEAADQEGKAWRVRWKGASPPPNPQQPEKPGHRP
jgi:hypothetical protein